MSTAPENNTLPQKVEEKPIDTIRALLAKSKAQIAMALPRHMNADRMMRIAVTACQKTPKLLDCRPVSLVGAVIQCAQLGLEPNDGTGRAWLIPYGSEVQFIPGYRGLIDLARRSGEIKRFDVRAVYSNDKFAYSFGLKPSLDHVPAQGERGDITYVYAVAEFKDGNIQFDVMSKEEVDKIRKRSKAATSGPWVTDYEEMAKKTVARRICKVLPVSPEAHVAVTLDERAELGLPQNLAMLADPNEKPVPEKIEEAPMPHAIGEVPQAAPEKAATPGGFKEFAGRVGRIAATEIKGRQFDVVCGLGEGDKETKFYTDVPEIAAEARKQDPKKRITFLYEEDGARYMLMGFKPAA